MVTLLSYSWNVILNSLKKSYLPNTYGTSFIRATAIFTFISWFSIFIFTFCSESGTIASPIPLICPRFSVRFKPSSSPKFLGTSEMSAPESMYMMMGNQLLFSDLISSWATGLKMSPKIPDFSFLYLKSTKNQHQCLFFGHVG